MPTHPRHAFSALAAVAIAAVASSCVVLGLREARALGVRARVRCTSRDLPGDLDGITIAFLADIHAGPLFGAARMADLVERVNGLDADVIVLGGDYVGGEAAGRGVFYPAAARLSAKYGVYAVLGNHDEWEGIDEARRGMASAGITSAGERVGADSHRRRHARYRRARRRVDRRRPTWPRRPRASRPGDVAVLVAHNPDSFAEALPLTPGVWALALAGHTHGGQFARRVPAQPAQAHALRQALPEAGPDAENGVPIMVSNGVGAVTLPLRFFARPEIHLITLERVTRRASLRRTGRPLRARCACRPKRYHVLSVSREDACRAPNTASWQA